MQGFVGLSLDADADDDCYCRGLVRGYELFEAFLGNFLGLSSDPLRNSSE